MGTRLLELAMPWLVTAGVLLVWQIGVDVLQIAPFVLPSPLAMRILSHALSLRAPSSIGGPLGVVSCALFGWPVSALVGCLVGMLVVPVLAAMEGLIVVGPEGAGFGALVYGILGCIPTALVGAIVGSVVAARRDAGG